MPTSMSKSKERSVRILFNPRPEIKKNIANPNATSPIAKRIRMGEEAELVIVSGMGRLGSAGRIVPGLTGVWLLAKNVKAAAAPINKNPIARETMKPRNAVTLSQRRSVVLTIKTPASYINNKPM